jgi:hypothetical protein
MLLSAAGTHVVCMRGISSRSQFCSASVGSYLGLTQPLMRYISTLSHATTARSLALTSISFLAGVFRKMSVALVHSQGYMCL